MRCNPEGLLSGALRPGISPPGRRTATEFRNALAATRHGTHPRCCPFPRGPGPVWQSFESSQRHGSHLTKEYGPAGVAPQEFRLRCLFVAICRCRSYCGGGSLVLLPSAVLRLRTCLVTRALIRSPLLLAASTHHGAQRCGCHVQVPARDDRRGWRTIAAPSAIIHFCLSGADTRRAVARPEEAVGLVPAEACHHKRT